jgi:hypothetical protein
MADYTLTADQQQQLAVAGIDGKKLVDLIVTRGPAVVLLVKQLIDLLLAPAPMVAAAGHDSDAAEATMRTLHAAICTAKCAAEAHCTCAR